MCFLFCSVDLRVYSSTSASLSLLGNLKEVMTSGRLISFTLFFFVEIVLPILGTVLFYMNFRISLFIKILAGVLIIITLYL